MQTPLKERFANKALFFSSVSSPAGVLHLAASDDSLVALTFESNWPAVRRRLMSALPQNEHKENRIITDTQIQLNEYFTGRRRDFSIPLSMNGTPFQRDVWMALLEIPYGSRWNYTDHAKFVGRPSAVRAVGGANALNPICILVPCHRVISIDGTLGGYAGGLEVKKFLLDTEARFFCNHL